MAIDFGTARKNTDGDRVLVPMLRNGAQIGEAMFARGVDGKIDDTNTFFTGENISEEIQVAARRYRAQNLTLLEAMLPVPSTHRYSAAVEQAKEQAARTRKQAQPAVDAAKKQAAHVRERLGLPKKK